MFIIRYYIENLHCDTTIEFPVVWQKCKTKFILYYYFLKLEIASIGVSRCRKINMINIQRQFDCFIFRYQLLAVHFPGELTRVPPGYLGVVTTDNHQPWGYRHDGRIVFILLLSAGE